MVPENLKEKAKRLFSVNEFNLVASDLISVNRSLQDARKPELVDLGAIGRGGRDKGWSWESGGEVGQVSGSP